MASGWTPRDPAPDGAALGFGRGSWLHSDPCSHRSSWRECSRRRESAKASTNSPVRSPITLSMATDPVPVTLGGYSGKYVDLQAQRYLDGG